MKDHEIQKENKKDPFDGDYIGNIWGWRNSYIALGFLLVMMLLAALNYDSNKVVQNESGTLQELPDTTQQSLSQ